MAVPSSNSNGAHTCLINVAFLDTNVNLNMHDVEARGRGKARRINWCQSMWNLCRSCGTFQAEAAKIYQKHQRYTHCEVYFPVHMFSAEEMTRIRALPPGTNTRPDELVVAFASFASFDSVEQVDTATAPRIHGGGKKPYKRSVQRHGVVGMLRVFSSPSYKTLSIRVTQADLVRAKNFAMSQIGKPYDFSAASWRLLFFPPSATTERWWCGSLAHGILQEAGLLRWQPLNTLTVGDIVTLINKSPRRELNAARPRAGRLVGDILTAALFAPTMPTGMPYPSLPQEIFDDVLTAVDTSCRKHGPILNGGACYSQRDS